MLLEGDVARNRGVRSHLRDGDPADDLPPRAGAGSSSVMTGAGGAWTPSLRRATC